MGKINKKGFTLVELLAVIVVLAIIALIGYTIVGDVISGAQESADKENVREYARSVSLAITSAQMNGEIIPSSLNSDWLSAHVEKTGNKVECKMVNVRNGLADLTSCSVNNSEIKYCYKNGEVTECDANVLAFIYGNSYQNGEPSPTSPVQIQNVGDLVTSQNSSYFGKYKISIVAGGDNILNKEHSTTGKFVNSSCAFTNSDYGLTVTEKIYVKPNTKYTYSNMGNVHGTSVTRVGCQYSSNDIGKTLPTSSGTDVSFTTDADTSYVILQYKNGQEPELKEVNEVNIYLDEPLRKVGDYVDYIDFTSGVVVRQVKEILFTGTTEEGWHVDAQSYGYRAYIPPSKNIIEPKEALVGLSNRFNIVDNLKNLGDFRIYVSASGSGLQFAQNLATNKSDWEKWVSNNNIVIHYVIDDKVTNIDIPAELYKPEYKTFEIKTNIQPSQIIIK